MKPIGPNQVTVVLLFFWVSLCRGAAEDEVSSLSRRKEPLQYCPYFKNRGPSKQDNIRNCSWYKENSCCFDEEIDFAFQQLTPLPGASKDCSQYLNYLYCYICAPNQNMFFKDFTLTVCEEFCDRVYSACKNAVLKGRKIRYIYRNGKDFCKGRRFETDKEENGKCFTYDSKHGVKGMSSRTFTSTASVIVGLFTLLTNDNVMF